MFSLIKEFFLLWRFELSSNDCNTNQSNRKYVRTLYLCKYFKCIYTIHIKIENEFDLKNNNFVVSPDKCSNIFQSNVFCSSDPISSTKAE